MTWSCRLQPAPHLYPILSPDVQALAQYPGPTPLPRTSRLNFPASEIQLRATVITSARSAGIMVGKAGISAVLSPKGRQRQTEIKCGWGRGTRVREEAPGLRRGGFLEEADALVADQFALCLTL